jgi:hypothetical protein
MFALALEFLQMIGSGFVLGVFTVNLIQQNGWSPSGGEARGLQQIFFYSSLIWFVLTLVNGSLFCGMTHSAMKLISEVELKNKILLRR